MLHDKLTGEAYFFDKLYILSAIMFNYGICKLRLPAAVRELLSRIQSLLGEERRPAGLENAPEIEPICKLDGKIWELQYIAIPKVVFLIYKIAFKLY